ncbi:MAG: hypothetical protein IKB02_09650 [Clostridia bacterium]|nr:hypothetical protein [Clostridia bacterium]
MIYHECPRHEFCQDAKVIGCEDCDICKALFKKDEDYIELRNVFESFARRTSEDTNIDDLLEEQQINDVILSFEKTLNNIIGRFCYGESCCTQRGSFNPDSRTYTVHNLFPSRRNLYLCIEFSNKKGAKNAKERK